MQDLSCLIAPRRLVVVAGEEDHISPMYGVEKGYETIKKIFEKSRQKENCKLVKTPKGHWWCEDIVWTAICEEIQKIGW